LNDIQIAYTYITRQDFEYLYNKYAFISEWYTPEEFESILNDTGDASNQDSDEDQNTE
jgi:hypothetical protein